MNRHRQSKKPALKNKIKEVLEEHPEGLRQNELKKELKKDFVGGDGYKTVHVLAQTLSDIRKEMVETGLVETERVDPEQGSLQTWKWRHIQE